MRLSLCSIVFAFVLAGCASHPTPASQRKTSPAAVPAPAVASPLRGPYWYLTAVSKRPIPPNALPPFLHFAPDSPRVSGNTGVNSLGGTYRDDGVTLTFTNVVTTKMAGLDADRNTLERELLAALEKPNLYQIIGSTLRMGELTFTAHDAPPKP